MVGVVGDFTLQSMARTNHKFPGSSGRIFEKEAKSTVPYVHRSDKDRCSFPIP